jgi:hypothetical protein
VSKAKYYQRAVKELGITPKERALLSRRGFVSLDHGQRYSFGSMYYAIYTRDLPVFITSDSILHAMHRSYDDVMMQIESEFFLLALDEVLSRCHDEVAERAKANNGKTAIGWAGQNIMDVDVYLSVARNLLKGAGAKQGGPVGIRNDVWNEEILVHSRFGQDQKVMELLKLVQSLKLQNPQAGDRLTEIYGGRRPVDYSQFKPRGHYSKSAVLKRYFRTMMWLGRADTGFNVLPPDPVSGIQADSRRELASAALLTTVLNDSGAAKRLRQMDSIIEFFVGQSDSLNPAEMTRFLQQRVVPYAGDRNSKAIVDGMQRELVEGGFGKQMIRSQLVFSNPYDSYQVPPPSIFQMFGQRYVLDSFVLSKVVYDSIIYRDQKMRRMMPQGLDVMCALGNNEAISLLSKDLKEFRYSAQLKASQDFVELHKPVFWKDNLYNIWLSSLRTLDDDLSAEKHLPSAMKTHAWQMKQLQTQLASWSELRHNTVLYAKQSYTAGVLCEYPTGYVEPYPQLYAQIRLYAEEAARRIAATDYTFGDKDVAKRLKAVQQAHVKFFTKMGETLGQLELLANKELAAEPFNEAEVAWLKKTIDKRGGGSGPPQYDGWYSDLFYRGGIRAEAWDPTIVDIHTDPNSKEVLEAGVGNCNFLVVAVDSEDDKMIYVGPAYSYYEFHEPAGNRLTDQQWQKRIVANQLPSRPAWTGEFQGKRVVRKLKVPPKKKDPNAVRLKDLLD